jgi:type IV secretion system protein VirB7
LHLSNIQIFKIIPFGGKQMNRILAVAILLVMAGCSVTQPYVTNISPAGEQGILVEKCKVQFNSLTAKVSTEQCNTSYVWLGNTSMGKGKSKDGANPNNNVITIK